MRKLILAISVLWLAMPSCDVMKQVGSSYNMVNCKYDYRSISGLSVAGIDVAQGLSLTNIARVTSLLSGGVPSSIPMNMTVNLDVSNPNQTDAMLSGMQYILAIDGVEFTTGRVSQAFNVAAGGTGVLPLRMGFDVAGLLSGQTKDAAANALKNFIGMGSEKSTVSLKIKPSFLVNNITVTSPVYIPVDFSFGGK